MTISENIVKELYEKELKVGYGQFMDIVTQFANEVDSGLLTFSIKHDSRWSGLMEYPNQLNVIIDIREADPAVLNRCTANIVTSTVNIIIPDSIHTYNVPFMGRRLYTRKMVLNRMKGIKYYTNVSVEFKGKEYIHSYNYTVNPKNGNISSLRMSFSHSIVSRKSGCYLTGYDDTSLNRVSLWVNSTALRKYYDESLFDEWLLNSFKALSEYTSNPFEFRRIIGNIGRAINILSSELDEPVTLTADAHTVAVTKNNVTSSDNGIGLMTFRSTHLTKEMIKKLLIN